MSSESELAAVWAALLSLSLLIASTLTAGYWFCVYREEAQTMQPFATDDCSTLQIIWDDIPLPK